MEVDVGPCPSGGLWAPAILELTVSECNDCASHSRARGVVAVGVAAEAKEKVVEFIADEDARLIFKGGGTEEDDEEEGFGMNEERRFWADDFRRIVGRGCSVA